MAQRHFYWTGRIREGSWSRTSSSHGDQTSHHILGGQEELRAGSWGDVPKAALRNPIKAMNPGTQTAVGAAIPSMKAEMNKGPGITTIMYFLGGSFKAALHRFSHPSEDSIYFL